MPNARIVWRALKTLLAIVALLALPGLLWPVAIQNRIGGATPDDSLIRLSILTTFLIGLGSYWIFAKRLPRLVKIAVVSAVVLLELFFAVLNVGARSVG